MSLKKFRWSRVYESSEEELIRLLHTRNIDSERIHIEAEARQIEKYTENVSTIWCAEGSLVVKTSSISTSLQPGDALSLGAGTRYSVKPGIAGCAYYLTR